MNSNFIGLRETPDVSFVLPGMKSMWRMRMI